ncbi:MAG TPA: hypothetical protein VLK84_32690 [Longimicrobium sp.]|nr:hypothetical protein [Longimicrobium sp.]
MKKLKISALALLSVLALGACDDDGGTGPGGLRQGQFEGDISGSLDIGVAGDADSGYGFRPGEVDLIVLTDRSRNIEIALFDSEGEFIEGRRTIEDENDFESRIIGYVVDLDTGESFGSVSGTLDLDNVTDSGRIQGSARFTAESDDIDGDFINVDVVFNTDYAGSIDFNVSPSFSRAQKN